MSATKILWGQVFLASAVVLAFLWAATEGGFIAASGVISAILVAVTLPVWRARARKRITTYGSARWAEKRDIRRAAAQARRRASGAVARRIASA